MVVDALGPTAAPDVDDDWLAATVAAANAAAYRKRHAAGYDDPDDPAAPAPTPDVALGATLWAVALWRERATVDGYSSYQGLETFTPTGGSWGQVRRLLGIGRGQVDTPASLTADASNVVALRRRPPTRWWP